MTSTNSNQSHGAKKPFVLPASIRVPVTTALFLAGVAIAFTTGLQPTNGTPILVPDSAMTMVNVAKGILWALSFIMAAFMFNTVFGPSEGATNRDLPVGDVGLAQPDRSSN